ncbi:hypothetical protein RUM44_007033 [Polyplax serrata]|uniref:Uncharacterized protein n=1 Tax=Polyplax serrata TaxID=468196 RepID=A0ABR1AZK9_POLSC
MMVRTPGPLERPPVPNKELQELTVGVGDENWIGRLGENNSSAAGTGPRARALGETRATEGGGDRSGLVDDVLDDGSDGSLEVALDSRNGHDALEDLRSDNGLRADASRGEDSRSWNCWSRNGDHWRFNSRKSDGWTLNDWQRGEFGFGRNANSRVTRREDTVRNATLTGGVDWSEGGRSGGEDFVHVPGHDVIGGDWKGNGLSGSACRHHVIGQDGKGDALSGDTGGHHFDVVVDGNVGGTTVGFVNEDVLDWNEGR